MAHLTSDSVQQLLMVLDLTRRAYGAGISPKQAYRDAVRRVSRHHDLYYQTIGDLRRRLGFPDIQQYRQQIELWLTGDAAPLWRTIATHSDVAAHALLKRFFEEGVLPNEGDGKDRVSQEPVVSDSSVRPIQTPLEELRLRINPDLVKRIQLAKLAKIGATIEDTAAVLIERGFEAEKDRIRQFLAGL